MQTRRMYLDFALSTRSSGDKQCYRVLKQYGRRLCKEMWLPTAESLGQKLDYCVLFVSVRAWTLLQLVKYKLFKVPLYVQ